MTLDLSPVILIKGQIFIKKSKMKPSITKKMNETNADFNDT